MLFYEDDEYLNREDIKCSLIGYGSYSQQMVIFTKDDYVEENYQRWFMDFKNDLKIQKVILMENGEQTILFERK